MSLIIVFQFPVIFEIKRIYPSHGLPIAFKFSDSVATQALFLIPRVKKSLKFLYSSNYLSISSRSTPYFAAYFPYTQLLIDGGKGIMEKNQVVLETMRFKEFLPFYVQVRYHEIPPMYITEVDNNINNLLLPFFIFWIFIVFVIRVITFLMLILCEQINGNAGYYNNGYQFCGQLDYNFLQNSQNMNESRSKSPEPGLKKSQIIGSPRNSNSKAYLPSRYAQERKIEKVGFHDILNSIQAKTSGDQIKIKPEGSPQLKPLSLKTETVPEQRRLKTSKFKSRPLKREKNDEIQYKEIFLDPREDALDQLKKKLSLEDNIKTISKEYQKLFRIQSNQRPESPKLDIKSAEEPFKNQNYQQAIQFLSSGTVFGINIETAQRDFYDNHILIEPPDAPNNESQQVTTTYSPSVPSNYKSYRNMNVKELLIRARGGSSGQNIEKEAHLSHILGEVYSQKKMFTEALRFHRRYLGFAKSMQDYVGMSLGANRVAISYYNCNEVQKSILFHNENLKLSNNDNCFVGFYNIGVCYRKLNKLNEALEYFESALAWAQERGEQESECIALGQIGVTYQIMQHYEQAIQKFEKSNQICERIKKEDLKLHNLRYILRISSMLGLKPIQQIQKIVQQAFILAQRTKKMNIFDIFRCNTGIVKGIQLMDMELDRGQQAIEIEEI